MSESENESSGSGSDIISDDEELFANAAYLCASAINNGWLSEFVDEFSDDDEDTDTDTDSDDSEASLQCSDDGPTAAKKFKSIRDAELLASIETLKKDPSIFTLKHDLFRRKAISPKMFDKLFAVIKKDISKKATVMRMPIPAEDKLAAVLRYLMTGCSFRDLEVEAKISRPAISLIIPSVCDSICNNLMHKYLRMPSSHEEWIDMAADYEAIWNFPLCVGAIDVRHIPVRCPKKEKKIYLNPLKYASIMMVALCDAKYRFRFVDIGCNGSAADEEALRQSFLQQIISNSNGDLPDDREIGKYSRLMPHVFVGDEALPLEKHLMKPFAIDFSEHNETEAKTFNMRLQCARQTIDLAMGKLWMRFPVMQNFQIKQQSVARVIQTCCILHNFLLEENEDVDAVDFDSLPIMTDSKAIKQEVYSDVALETRRQFTEYFFYENQLEPI